MWKTFLFLFLFPLLTTDAGAEERRFSYFMLGASLNDSRYEVTQNEQSEAKLFSEKRKIAPALSLVIYPRPFIDVPILRILRWSFEIGGNRFNAKRQLVDRVTDVTGTDDRAQGNEIDLGTQIKGEAYYATPTINLYFEATSWLHFFLGFGAGLGYSNIKGNYYRTDGPSAGADCLSSTTLADVQTNCSLREVSFHKTGLSSSAFAGGFLGPLGYRFSRGGPTYKDSGSKHKADVESGSVFFQLSF